MVTTWDGVPRILRRESLKEEKYSVQNIVARLSNLRKLIDELRDSDRIPYLAPRSCLEVLVDGLSRNEGFARRELRVAKHSTGTAQQKLFVDIRKSLDELEMVIELVLH